MEIDPKYMARALQLARKGLPYAMPNPMVGAVIVGPDGAIIGEGYHRRCGEAHAEVNAIAAVRDPALLRKSTMYVTLEPCAHYGRTGPCADLIVSKGIPRVVVGTRDPFSKVNGRGIGKLLAAGIEVAEGVMERECRSLNAIFFTAHTERRPFIMLKWAESADGWLDLRREPGTPGAAISSPATRVLGHQLRAVFDAILVGSGTVLADDPSLTLRSWPGNAPKPIVLDRRGRVGEGSRLARAGAIVVRDAGPLRHIMAGLYEQGITSVLVEGGAEVLKSFIADGLWDLARVETGPVAFGKNGRAAAPSIVGADCVETRKIGLQQLKYYVNNPLVGVKNL